MKVDITSDHDIFKGKGQLSPISKLIGRPILVFRHLQGDFLDYIYHPQCEQLNNIPVGNLMVDPKSGNTPLE